MKLQKLRMKTTKLLIFQTDLFINIASIYIYFAYMKIIIQLMQSKSKGFKRFGQAYKVFALYLFQGCDLSTNMTQIP